MHVNQAYSSNIFDKHPLTLLFDVARTILNSCSADCASTRTDQLNHLFGMEVVQTINFSFDNKILKLSLRKSLISEIFEVLWNYSEMFVFENLRTVKSPDSETA